MRRVATLLVLTASFVVPHGARAQATTTGAIAGTVFDSLRTRAPLRDASVMLTELNRVATTDSRGRFRFDGVPDGRYSVTFFSAVLDSVGIGAPIATVTVSRGLPAETWLATPSPENLYRRLCGIPKEPSLAAIIGHVRDVDTGRPIDAASIETFWAEFEYQTRNFRRRMFKASTRTGAEGAYILCGVPSDVPLDVIVRSGAWQAGPVTVNHGRDIVAMRNFGISRSDSAARADSTQLLRDSTHIPVGTGVVRGTLRDRTGRPVADAPVRIVADARETRSGADGAFVLTGVPAGTRTVEARAIGYGPTTAEVDVPTRGTATANILFDRRAQELKAITVTGQKPRPDINGYMERSRAGIGRYVDEDELKRRPVSRVGDALLRSGNVTYDMTQFGPEVKMRATGSVSNDSRCVPNYYLDGMLLPTPGGNERQTMLQMVESMVLPQDVRGIEIYSGLGGVPAQFDRFNGCGSILIWTR